MQTRQEVARFVAEAVGTFYLVFIGASAAVLDHFTHSGLGLVGGALANGLALGTGVTATMNISGGVLNPAVAVGLWALRKLNTARAALYIIAQLLGATVAALLVRGLFPAAEVAAVHAGAPSVSSAITPWQAAGIEAALTFLLMASVLLTAVDARAPRVGGYGIGLTVLFDVLAGGALTGAAMNPARSFGPALAAGFWANHWVYWLGPIVGALVASGIYALALAEPASSPAPAAAASGKKRRQGGGR